MSPGKTFTAKNDKLTKISENMCFQHTLNGPPPKTFGLQEKKGAFFNKFFEFSFHYKFTRFLCVLESFLQGFLNLFPNFCVLRTKFLVISFIEKEHRINASAASPDKSKCKSSYEGTFWNILRKWQRLFHQRSLVKLTRKQSIKLIT